MNASPITRKRIAIHEAAHAVVAHVLGFRVRAITVGPSKGGLLTQEDVRIEATLPPEEKLDRIVSYIAVAVAGAVFDSGAVLDPGAVFESGILNESRYGGDRERLENVRAACGMLHEVFQPLITQGVDRARKILEQYADTVREIADEVLRYSGRLDGWRARKIIQEPRKRPTDGNPPHGD